MYLYMPGVVCSHLDTDHRMGRFRLAITQAAKAKFTAPIHGTIQGDD